MKFFHVWCNRKATSFATNITNVMDSTVWESLQFFYTICRRSYESNVAVINNRQKKCFTWGVRNLGAVEVVFVSKTWPLRLIRNYFAYARFCLSEKILKKKLFENFFLKIFDFWKFRKNISANFFRLFLVKMKSLNHWLYYVKIWMLYCKHPMKYRPFENCTKNDVFCPKMSLG